MTTTNGGAVLRCVRKILAPTQEGVSDSRLLERFVNERDEAAFELLVWRHERMVLGVCRRMLRDVHDADDAFQETFLTLAKKAECIGKRQAVAGWLHTVAYRIALDLKSKAARRGVWERTSIDLSAVPSPRESQARAGWSDLSVVLDEELARLPQKYRVPLVLCYLEGKTYAEAARQLGCPAGTVSARLARARAKLGARLARRGVDVAGGLLAALLCERAASAAAPAALIAATVNAGMTLATGQATTGMVLARTAFVTQGALQAMYVSKLTIAAVVLVVVVAFGAGVVYHVQSTKPADRSAQAAAIKPSDGKSGLAPGAPEQENRIQVKGQLLQQNRCQVFSAVEGTVVGFGAGVEPGAAVEKDQPLIRMYDVQLEMKIREIQQRIEAAEKAIASLRKQRDQSGQSATDKARIASEMADTKAEIDLTSTELLAYQGQLLAWQEETHSDKDKPGEFWVLAPITGNILSSNFKQNLTNRYVKPSQPLLQIRDKDGPWEIELKIPQELIGRILQAFDPRNPGAELDVELQLVSAPEKIFPGKLSRTRIAAEVSSGGDSGSDKAAAIVLATVTIAEPSTSKNKAIPRSLLVSGTEVQATILVSK
jgi:RNA polymerase sigma factor (sigma-70 family)